MLLARLSITLVALIVCFPGLLLADAAAGRRHDHEMMYELRKTAHLLSKANHDYKGHRGGAIKQIHIAIDDLKKEAHLQGFPGEGPAYNGNEPQWKSNKQLHRAIAELRHVHTRLRELTHTKLRHKAAEHIHKAIKELEIALKVQPNKK